MKMIWWLMVVVVGSGSDKDDVMMLMTTTMTTTIGSREICRRGEEKDDGRWTLQTLLNYSFSISSRRIPIASLICSCFYHLPTDATRGMTSFRKNSIYWHYLCLAFVHKMGRVKQKICSFSRQYKPVGLVILYWKYSSFLGKPVLAKKRWPKELKLSNIVLAGCFIDDLTIVLL